MYKLILEPNNKNDYKLFVNLAKRLGVDFTEVKDMPQKTKKVVE
jgi:hypothetical protein